MSPKPVRCLRAVFGPPSRFVRDAAESVLARHYYRRRYRWPHPLLTVIGPSRSGTQLVAMLLAEVPAYRWRLPHDPDRCTDRHDLCEAVFAGVPWNRYTVLKLHTRPTPENLRLLERRDVRAVVVFRDLRDICVARYFAVLHNPRHRHHREYQAMSKAAGMSHCLEIVLEECVPWIQGWRSILRQQADRFHLVRYEALRPDPRAALGPVLDFYGLRRSSRQIDRIARAVAAKTRYDLAANYRNGMVTARKGVVGDWKNHFTGEHVRRMKQGGGQLLIELGYERDLAW